MSAPAIRVEQLGKQYRLGLREVACDSLAERLTHLLTAPWRRYRKLREQSDGDDLFWALRDVTFEVQPGEVIGIIGPNGAGKSTLLKILSRITEPTTGRAELRGTVRSLLEVGTGFHPELSGRENIYLNGAVLGMRKLEIDAHFDAIVEFAEISRFLDTPVKRYSSGMYVRLAFAVAAHLQPEILIVDEVLAVGDATFQRKCLGTMREVASSGRTVLFVSHNMTAIRNLCTRALLLRDGRVALAGETAAVVHAYLGQHNEGEVVPDSDLRHWPARRGGDEVRIVHARLLDEAGRVCGRFNRLGPLTMEYTFESQSRAALNLSAAIKRVEDGTKILQLAHQDTAGFAPGSVRGTRTVRVTVPALPLQCGEYQWDLNIHTESLGVLDCVQDVLRFCVDDDLERSARPFRSTCDNGLCSLPANWQYVSAEQPAYALQSS